MPTPRGARLSVGRSPQCRADASRLTGRACPPFSPHPHGRGGPAAVVAILAAAQTAGDGGGAGGPSGRGYILDRRWRGATDGRRLRRPGAGGQPRPCNGGRRPRQQPDRGARRRVGRRRRGSFTLTPWGPGSGQGWRPPDSAPRMDPLGAPNGPAAPLPRAAGPSPPRSVPSRSSWRPAAADQVYDSVEALAHALQAQLPTFTPWQRHDPSFKPIVSGAVWTSAGPRQVTIMLDTGATHCFICAQLASLLHLPVSSAPGPMAVSLATADTTRLLPSPVVVHLALGTAEPLREVITMSPLDLGPELDIILGWDWISSHDLRFLYPQGGVVGEGPHGSVSAPLRPFSGPPATRAAVLIGHGEFRRTAGGPSRAPADFHEPAAVAAPLAARPARRHSGMSKPLDPLGTAELAEVGPPTTASAGSPARGAFPRPAAHALCGWHGTSHRWRGASPRVVAVRRRFDRLGPSRLRCPQSRAC